MNGCLSEARLATSNKAVSVVALSGFLDINSVGEFEVLLLGLFKERRYQIVLNLDKLTYVSSAGIGVILSVIKEVRKNRGDIKIVNVGPDIYKVFDLLEIPRVIQILKTEEDAVNAF